MRLPSRKPEYEGQSETIALLTRDLASILSALHSDRGSAEKRRDPRVGIRLRVEAAIPLHDRKGLQRVGAWVRDISATGAAVVLQQSIPSETNFLLLLASEREGTIAVPCKALHVRSAGNGFYYIGARFIAKPYVVNADGADAAPNGKPVANETELQALQRMLKPLR